MSRAKLKLPPDDKITMLENSPAGFRAWLRVCEPRIVNDEREWVVFVPTPQQEKFIDEMLESTDGKFNFKFIFLSQPRRHGKSTLFLMFILWLFSTRDQFTIQLIGSHERHSKNTQFNRLQSTIYNSPKLLEQIGSTRHFTELYLGRASLDEKHHRNQQSQIISRIQSYSGTALDGAFGDRCALIWISDLHVHRNMSVINAWQASLLDSKNTLVLCDTNCGGYGSPDHNMELMAQDNPRAFCHRTEYKDIVEYIEKVPTWIDLDQLETLQKTYLPEEFAATMLGQRQKGEQNLFSPDQIKAIQAEYQFPVSKEAFHLLTKDKKYNVSMGLDRAKSLVKTSKSDATVLSTVLKLHNAGKEANYILLDQVAFLVNTDANIVSTILQQKDRYGHIDNITLENYEVSSLYLKLCERKLICELITPSQQSKNVIIPAAYHIISDKRLQIPTTSKALINELLQFQHRRNANGTFAFSHPPEGHDDNIDSLVYAIYASREAVSSNYQLESIMCDNRMPSRIMCFLMHGNHTLHGCSQRCAAFQTVVSYHRNYLYENPNSEVSLTDFYQTLVNVTCKNYRF